QSVLPGVQVVISLIKRLVLGTFQGRFEKKYIQAYLDEYTFRFNRRNCKHVGKKFFRIAQQSVVTSPRSYKQIIGGTLLPALANSSLE
ncbi:MAG: transposase, partial [Desulfatitalea sp.]